MRRCFLTDVFQRSLTNTLLYVAITVPGSVLLGLGAALLIEADRSLRTFYSAIYFLPVMATLIAMSIVWEFMLHPQFGIVNQLVKALGLGPHRLAAGSVELVLFTLCGIGIWQSLGFNMVLFMAGLTVDFARPLRGRSGGRGGLRLSTASDW